MTVDGKLTLPDPPPPTAAGGPWLRHQRHAVLNSLLGLVLAISFPAIVYTIVVTIQRGSLSFNGAYYLATYLIIAVLFLARRLSDWIRVVATLAVIYGFALLALYSGWLAGSGRGFLLSLILISSLLIQVRISRVVAVLALLTFAWFGWAYASGRLDVQTSPVTDLATIMIEGVGFALAVGVVVSTQLFLGRAIEAANRAGQEARQAQQLLDQRARQLQSANKRLEQMSQLKDEFVSNVSHELRTPISSMILHQELLHIHPDKREFYLSTIRRETDRLAHIIEGLLNLSRLDQARVEYKPVLMDLNTIAAVYVADRKALADNRKISLGLESEPGLPSVEADEGLIGQALGILMTNALNYTPPGGSVTVITRRRTSEGKDWAGLAVLDTGPGIPPEELPHMFERFFRGTVGRSSGSPGTGLGLSIAKEIVDRHQGKLELARTGGPGQGAEFAIWIPIPAA